MAFDYVSSFYEGGKWAKQVAKRLNDEGGGLQYSEVANSIGNLCCTGVGLFSAERLP
jgi:hypothetical protein